MIIIIIIIIIINVHEKFVHLFDCILSVEIVIIINYLTI